METKGTHFKEIMLDVLLADPITVKGKGALTSLGHSISESDYLKNLYVEPFTLYNHISNETLDEKADPDFEYVTKVEKNVLITKKESFEFRLKKLGDSLYIIKGGAGSGKTTYVHHLQQEHSNIKFIFCDFEQSRKAISLFGIPYDFGEKYDSNVWKFISIIAEKITQILLEHDAYSQFGEHIGYIKAIVQTYQAYFSILKGNITVIDEESMWEFFAILNNFVNGEFNFVHMQNKLKNLVVDKFNELDKKERHKEAITYICGILTRLFFCLNKINKIEKYVCVIDNIEYFVPFDEKHPIQECELQVIVDGVSDSITRIRPSINKWKELFDNYNTFYGFLLVTRDTSVSLAEYRHFDDFTGESEIDISTWFCVDDIYKSKINYFQSVIQKLKTDQYFIAYNNIIEDMSQYNWGLHDLICRMYNYNYRRIVFDVVNAIANQPEQTLKYFNDRWEECSQNADLGHVKHMCRKYIFRVLLEYIQRSHYFDDLLVENRNASTRRNLSEDFNNKSSYARKTANTLYRISLEEHRQNNSEFVTFPEIITAVLKPPYFELPDTNQIEDLASILYLMNESRNHKTNWAPLIMIKFDSEQIYNKQNLILEMKAQWTDYINNHEKFDKHSQKYGVKITAAGSFFAKMVPDFEYFACRFASKYPALLVIENLKPCTNKNGKSSYQCLELIKIVRTNAFLCIDEVIERDKDFFRNTGRAPQRTNRFSPLYNRNSPYKWIYISDNNTTTMVPHPLRILNHQIGYLQHYFEYVNGLTAEYLAPTDKEKILDGIQSEIKLYADKIRNIKSNNPDYFKCK